MPLPPAVDQNVEGQMSPDADLREPGMRLFEIDPLHDPRWRTFTEGHPDASVFHRVEWLRALKSCYGYVPIVLSSSPPGYPLTDGLPFCKVRSAITGNRLVSLPFSDHCEPLMSRPEQLSIFMSGLAERVDDNGWKYFEIRPINSTPAEQTSLGISDTYYLHHLDLRPSEQVLFKGFQKDSIQRKIRRAEREALRYEAGTSNELLSYFYKLLIMTRRKHGLPPQPLKWFRSLIACMGKDVNIRVALKGDIPVASILTLSNQKTLIYKYGCSDGRFGNLGGTALLFWNAIQEAKASGVEELDMGRSDTDNVGLVTFKDRWGTKRSTVHYWRYPFRPASSKPEGLVRYAKRIISVAPDVSLVALGNLLYRHIG